MSQAFPSPGELRLIRRAPSHAPGRLLPPTLPSFLSLVRPPSSLPPTLHNLAGRGNSGLPRPPESPFSLPLLSSLLLSAVRLTTKLPHPRRLETSGSRPVQNNPASQHLVWGLVKQLQKGTDSTLQRHSANKLTAGPPVIPSLLCICQPLRHLSLSLTLSSNLALPRSLFLSLFPTYSLSFQPQPHPREH